MNPSPSLGYGDSYAAGCKRRSIATARLERRELSLRVVRCCKSWKKTKRNWMTWKDDCQSECLHAQRSQAIAPNRNAVLVPVSNTHTSPTLGGDTHFFQRVITAPFPVDTFFRHIIINKWSAIQHRCYVPTALVPNFTGFLIQKLQMCCGKF